MVHGVGGDVWGRDGALDVQEKDVEISPAGSERDKDGDEDACMMLDSSDSGVVAGEGVNVAGTTDNDIVTLGACSTFVSQVPQLGTGAIDDILYTAAWTCGDGGCGLHWMFGRPDADGCLYCEDVRGKILSQLPLEVGPAFARVPYTDQTGKHVLSSAFDRIWDEARRGAVFLELGVSISEAGRETQIIWSCLPAPLQEEFVEVARLKRFEEAQLQTFRGKLEMFARDFFQSENEEHMMRSLCYSLGYLTTCERNFLQEPISDASYEHEGPCGNLQLLHPCVGSDAPNLTKYQGLFQPDASFANVRNSFFTDNTHKPQNGSKDLLLESMEHLIADLRGKGMFEKAEFLIEGKKLLAERVHQHATNLLPPSCTNAVAWQVWLEAFGDAEYFLSTEDVFLIGAFWHTSVSLYTSSAIEDPNAGLQFACGFNCPDSRLHARGVLSYDKDDGNPRGHYSRLFTDADWQDLYKR